MFKRIDTYYRIFLTSFGLCLSLGIALSYAAVIEDFDTPKRDQLIAEIKELLELPEGDSLSVPTMINRNSTQLIEAPSKLTKDGNAALIPVIATNKSSKNSHQPLGASISEKNPEKIRETLQNYLNADNGTELSSKNNEIIDETMGILDGTGIGDTQQKATEILSETKNTPQVNSTAPLSAVSTKSKIADTKRVMPIAAASSPIMAAAIKPNEKVKSVAAQTIPKIEKTQPVKLAANTSVNNQVNNAELMKGGVIEKNNSLPQEKTIVTKTNLKPSAASAQSIKQVEETISAQAPAIIVLAKANVKHDSVVEYEEETYSPEDSISAIDEGDTPRNFQEALARDQKNKKKKLGTKITGELYSSVGLYSNGDFRINRANPDLNERNYRILSDKALNNRLNTFDPALYSRMKFVVDSSITKSVATHINVTIDPWSYTGKSKEVIIQQGSGDMVKYQYLSVGSNNYTIGRIIRTMRTGDALALPEMKIRNGNEIPGHRVRTTFNGYFDLPETKLDYSFMPIREAWLDFKPTDSVFLRLFPLAYEDQALTSDDPLRVSNNRSYWEESPWLRSWQSGNYNDLAGSYNKGYWDRSLSFGTRDSTGMRLTNLRGAKFSFVPEPDTTLDFVIASPKTLWQNYSDFDTMASSARLKHYFDDGLYIGGTAAAHQGYKKSSLDGRNYVGAIDTGIMPLENVKFEAEYSFSSSQYDVTDARWQTKKDGKAYYAALSATSDPYMMNRKDYYGIASGSKDANFYKTRVFVGRMDQDYEATLSNYHSTRKDAFWNRHLTFYPSTFRYLPGVAQLAYTGEDDLSPYAIGTGLDYGRMAYGWRYDVGLLDGDLKGIMDVRQVVNVEGQRHKKIETVSQTHWNYKVTDDLRTKFLFVWDKMPMTKAGIDPHVYDGETGEALENAAVRGGEDPSTTTTAVGARYQLTPWAAVNGVWEYTNDSTLATDNFPQANLNSAFITTYRDDGRLYTKQVPFVYSGGLFDLPPYNYFSIQKMGLELIPTDKWHIYLDFTRNSNVFAGNIDDNMNHFGIESSYLITKNWGVFGRYTYTRWNDFGKLGQSVPEIEYRGYHNLYFATNWVFAPDSRLSLEYGVGPAYNVATNVYDPRLAYYSTTALDTQHLIRLSVLKKF